MDQRRFTAVLVEFARTLTADFSVQRTLDHLVERVLEVLPVTGAGVLMMDRADNHYFLSATDDVIRSIEGLQVELGEGPCFEAYRSGQAVAVPDLAADRRFPSFSERALAAGLGGVASLPLRLDDVSIGALEIYTAEPAELTERDLRAAQTLADVMAAYVFNARARSAAAAAARAWRRESLHDALTGLPNRTLVHDRLDQALRSLDRGHGTVGVLFLDIDGLKAVNDAHGHAAGDELLRAVAARAARVVRPQDTVGRLSGDEFVVVCGSLAGCVEAVEIAHRVLEAVAAPITIDGAPLAARVSVGVACAQSAGETSDQLLRRADAAMYEAKRLGGGRMAVAGELTVTSAAQDDVQSRSGVYSL